MVGNEWKQAPDDPCFTPSSVLTKDANVSFSRRIRS